MPTFTIATTTSRAEGPGRKGPWTLIACHGTPWSSFVWRATLDALAPDHAVHAWDMIGYGRSDKPDDDVSLATQGELLVAPSACWGLDAPDVVAHDVGGAVALSHDEPGTVRPW